MENIGKFTVGLALLIAAIVIRGWVVSTLWGWFIVPVFHAPVLSIMQAVGLSLVAGVFTTSLRDFEDKSEKSVWEQFLIVTLANLFFLATGYVYTFFLPAF